ncbi:DUF3472 domain-containing protein [Luteolibacter arcticus]|uniref:DUF3472 domain-containing protein n=1 Tax=Luteolibacter arcticus TaxID=1581411 RepID=A0ABT3GPQ7_9BACT|nr:DUF3472 domain-containing protein [Luteolibacter arcticus]MCW1925499.1 DUF3472 domain-containing protein [Luteolibacter arcticus]
MLLLAQIRPWLLLAGLAPLPLHAAEKAVTSWTVPLAGNAYVTSGEGGQRWDDPKMVRSIYFRVDRSAELKLALKATVPQGESKIRATVEGKTFNADLKGSADFALGTIKVKEAGYVRVDLQGVTKDGPVFAEAGELLVSSETRDLTVAFVKDNEGNRFYWGRRGPSVHLGYKLPEKTTIEWFYNEVTVPEGKDPIGSYFMANGFGEGYFGIQVNSPTERRVLFSVWSPFSTDKPSEIPEDQRIALLAKGDGVHGGEFGGEGSGGQSYLRFPWKAGTTYRFLNRAKPDGKGHTVYTAWFFAPEANKWQLVASFKRPKTDKHMTGMHSFLENFADRNGWQNREAHYGNQWARDTEGNWHALTEARFTGDDIASRGYRLDYAGGVTGKEFFMRNGGFFADTVKLKSSFTRPSSGKTEPKIDFEKLEAVTTGLN